MDATPSTPQERTFTPEQKRALGRVYALLLNISEKQSNQLALEKEQAEKAGHPGENAETGAAHQAGEQG